MTRKEYSWTLNLILNSSLNYLGWRKRGRESNRDMILWLMWYSLLSSAIYVLCRCKVISIFQVEGKKARSFPSNPALDSHTRKESSFRVLSKWIEKEEGASSAFLHSSRYFTLKRANQEWVLFCPLSLSTFISSVQKIPWEFNLLLRSLDQHHRITLRPRDLLSDTVRPFKNYVVFGEGECKSNRRGDLQGNSPPDGQSTSGHRRRVLESNESQHGFNANRQQKTPTYAH